ncbi:hypothetical protein BC629DRAFT_645394 [Irpex lacteus]|nr:hypothetical protein BC629DRAFT_645394 [Irpex lacteus]
MSILTRRVLERRKWGSLCGTRHDTCSRHALPAFAFAQGVQCPICPRSSVHLSLVTVLSRPVSVCPGRPSSASTIRRARVELLDAEAPENTTQSRSQTLSDLSASCDFSYRGVQRRLRKGLLRVREVSDSSSCAIVDVADCWRASWVAVPPSWTLEASMHGQRGRALPRIIGFASIYLFLPVVFRSCFSAFSFCSTSICLLRVSANLLPFQSSLISHSHGL